MTTRDRLLSSLSSAHDQVLHAIDQHFTNLRGDNSQSGPDPSATATPPSHSSRDTGGLLRNPTLPTYAPQPSPNDSYLPEAVLRSPPGRAQQTYDSLPRSRLERIGISDQERKRVAEEMRRGQDLLHRSATHQQRQSQAGSGSHTPLGGPTPQRELAKGLKRIHSYASSNGKVVVDLFTQPQRCPTFMGGSAERGRGAMSGQVVIFSNDWDRVGAVRLKIKAVSTISIPRSYLPPSEDPNKRSSTPIPSNVPVSLVGRSPKTEPTQQKEHLVLQLERTLWNPEAADQSMVLTPPETAGGAAKEDPMTWKAGRHAFQFKVDLPTHSLDGQELPPSFVFLADARTNAPSLNGGSSGGGGGQLGNNILAAKKWLAEAAVGGLGAGEWASIKWYVKVTVERPGFLRSNDRVFVPFVYLPAPPPKLPQALLPTRQKLSNQARQDPLIQGARMVEPITTWGHSQLNLEPHGRIDSTSNITGKRISQADTKSRRPPKSNGSSFWSRLFSSPEDSRGAQTELGRPVWTLALPNNPPIWPLRSTIPFELRLEGVWGPHRASVHPPSVGLFMRVTLINPSKPFLGGKSMPMSAHETRLISVAQTFPDRNVSGRANLMIWRGLLDLPPQASPCFDSLLTKVEYFVAVQGFHQAGGGPVKGGAGGMGGSGKLVWSQTVVLVCPLPVEIQPPRVARTPTAINTGRGTISRSRRNKGRTSPNRNKRANRQLSRVNEKLALARIQDEEQDRLHNPRHSGEGMNTGGVSVSKNGYPARPPSSRRTSSYGAPGVHSNANGKARQTSSTSQSPHTSAAIAAAHALGQVSGSASGSGLSKLKREGTSRPLTESRRSSGGAVSVASSSGRPSTGATGPSGGKESRRPSASADVGRTSTITTSAAIASSSGGAGERERESRTSRSSYPPEKVGRSNFNNEHPDQADQSIRPTSSTTRPAGASHLDRTGGRDRRRRGESGGSSNVSRSNSPASSTLINQGVHLPRRGSGNTPSALPAPNQQHLQHQRRPSSPAPRHPQQQHIPNTPGRSSRRGHELSSPSYPSSSVDEDDDVSEEEDLSSSSSDDGDDDDDDDDDDDEVGRDGETWDFDPSREQGEIFGDADDDRGGMGMDLPPSYFEATGLRDED